MEQGMDSQSKLKCLMDLVKEMKGLHGKPKAVELEIHAEKAMPSEDDMESPEGADALSEEHQAEESPEMAQEDHSEEHGIHPLAGEEMSEESEDEELSPMELSPELLKLLQAHLLSKK